MMVDRENARTEALKMLRFCILGDSYGIVDGG
jgi:hypothetical protein